MVESSKKIKKRGRKSKGKIIDYTDNIEVDSSELPVILHLPIKLSDVNSDNIIEENSANNLNNDIFIKSEDISNKDLQIQKLQLEIDDLKSKLFSKDNSINTCSMKCWWCKNFFDTPKVGLPNNYFNEKFICTGNFCSYNCALSYNLDLNDENVWKRRSLLLKLYEDTYKSYTKISPSPSWKVLKEYGGTLTIEEYRNQLVSNDEEYIYLHPPLIYKLSQIDKKYKKNSKLRAPLDSIKKYTDTSEDYVLKRSKPLKSSRYSLENTMGLKIKKKKSRFS